MQPAPGDGQESIRALKWAAVITRTKAELLVLSQLAYWFGVAKDGKRRCRVRRDGFWWVVKTYRNLARETWLSRDQVRGAIRSLCAAGVVVAADDVEAGHLVRYRLGLARIQELVEEKDQESSRHGGPAGGGRG